jgi:hypothetical protein
VQTTVGNPIITWKANFIGIVELLGDHLTGQDLQIRRKALLLSFKVTM